MQACPTLHTLGVVGAGQPLLPVAAATLNPLGSVSKFVLQVQ